MKVTLACAVALASALAWLAEPLAAASPAVAAGPGAAALPTTRITIPGHGGDRVFDGVGAILGGGGNARYLLDYPRRQRTQIMDYLFKPGYGAALQILKLEIGGDANSSDGAEASTEHTRGSVNCRAGYELTIAQRALALNPRLKIYGLQWAAPGWVKRRSGTRFTPRDITYLLGWLGCARRRGVPVSYLGGWNESDTGVHHRWFRELRHALNSHGYRRVQIVASDSSGNHAGWHYVGDRSAAILGTHNVCGVPTGIAGPATRCTSPWSRHHHTRQPLWASELGGMDAGAQPGCRVPCAPAFDRAVVRGYVDARLTGFLEWPVLDAMPPGLPFENRGLVTASQPWAGSYRVNAMTWATAQLTQVAYPPSGRTRWRYVNSASGLLRGHRASGSYVTLLRKVRVQHRARHHKTRTTSRVTAWSTIVEATTATTAQRARFHVAGALARHVVHVWASDFSGASTRWFARQRSIRPGRDGTFSLDIRPGWVYSLTTTSGPGHGRARGRAAAPLRLPVTESLASSGRAGRGDDEPPYLAAQDGAFELSRCRVADRRTRRCTTQQAAATPVFWHNGGAGRDAHFPYAVIGSRSWGDYQVSVDVLVPRGGTAGVIGRFGCRRSVPHIGQFNGYVFDVASNGTWRLIRNADPHPGGDARTSSTGCSGGPRARQTLASGTLGHRLGSRTWYRLSLAMSGASITASVGSRAVAQVSDSAWLTGLAGLEAGAFRSLWPRVQYSHLAVTRVN
jgi:Glycosyl hydrolase family 59